jgi:hypothetical protein
MTTVADTVPIARPLDRIIEAATRGDPRLGLLRNLPGRWVGKGRGWNMIALPLDAAHSGGRPDAFRVLLNQFDETLEFTNALIPAQGSASPGGVPNRGTPNDQFLNGLQYIQHIDQLTAIDSLGSTISPVGAAAIHHEPGFFLRIVDQHAKNEKGETLEIARLGTIPHGDSVAALGNGKDLGPVVGIDLSPGAIGDFSALPIGAGPRDTAENGYLAPYAQFHANPFKGNVAAPNFPGFDPTNPLALLQPGAPTNFAGMTVITLDTVNKGGIVNLPFIVRHANATEMRFVLWVEELVGSTAENPLFQLQYAQRVLLDFFPSFGDPTKKIRWPHITINTLDLDPD